MSKITNINPQQSLYTSIENRLFEFILKNRTWYTNSHISFPVFIVFGLIDIAGFFQVLTPTVNNDSTTRYLITASLAVAFEIAPLYIGYSLCLKCYHLGHRIHNWVLVFSCLACSLGIIGNIFFRFKTMDIAYIEPTTGNTSKVALPITVLMCLLPIITSLISLVVGCLTFDPLQMHLLKLSKKMAKLKQRRQQIKASLEEFNDESTLKKTLEADETALYQKAKQDIHTIQTTLKTYSIVRTSSSFMPKKDKAI